MPIEALGFFMESNFVKYRKGEFNGKREIFCPRRSFLQRAKRKQLAKYCGQDFGSFALFFALVGVFSNEPSLSN
ncbi:hypothetical protein BWI92_13155 [Flectobacillus sp. BAB-3569]|nr:hypothetical protein BWI92_13155 [Flectobacillus sp. BAB-3569]